MPSVQPLRRRVAVDDLPAGRPDAVCPAARAADDDIARHRADAHATGEAEAQARCLVRSGASRSSQSGLIIRPLKLGKVPARVVERGVQAASGKALTEREDDPLRPSPLRQVVVYDRDVHDRGSARDVRFAIRTLCGPCELPAQAMMRTPSDVR